MTDMSLLPAASGQESYVGVRRVGRFFATYTKSAAWVTACLVGGAIADVVKGRLL